MECAQTFSQHHSIDMENSGMWRTGGFEQTSEDISSDSTGATITPYESDGDCSRKNIDLAGSVEDIVSKSSRSSFSKSLVRGSVEALGKIRLQRLDTRDGTPASLSAPFEACTTHPDHDKSS